MGDGTEGNPLTRKDVLKAIEKNGGTATGLDLSGRKFERSIDLRQFNLLGIILKKARLYDAHLEGALLAGAQLQEAGLTGAHLKGAILMAANLEGTYLKHTSLQEADLTEAKLSRAWLEGAKLSSTTALESVGWGRDYICGEEASGNFGQAERTYRPLKQRYTDAGMYDTAAKFYYREKEANRKSLKLCSKKNWNNRLAAEFMRAFFGYGEKWWNILLWMIAVIFGFAAAYYFRGSFSSSSFLDTLYYSAASFTALGYGNWAPEPTGWAKYVGAIEAFMGVFMMALILVTFVRKWTR